MKRWFYTSEEVRPFSPARLAELCAAATLRNMQVGLTGFLTHGQGLFQQYLEGPEQALDVIAAAIRADARHEIVSALPVWDGAARLFPRWGMFDASTASVEVEQLTAGLRFLYLADNGLEREEDERALVRDLIEAVAEVHDTRIRP